ncbi:MAG: nucleotide sugar dehydrogenase [Micrococcaceae bacterium]|nr:nucleotide sugar dehydrogenase [Micrococcaceae bacterium]
MGREPLYLFPWGKSMTANAILRAPSEDGAEQLTARDSLPMLKVVAPPEFDFDVAIVGMGYVGLPTALAQHAAGAKVLGFDVSQGRLEAIRNSKVDLLPSDHGRLVDALASQSLRLSTDPQDLARAAAVVVCVPTPIDEFQVPDLSILRAASQMVVEHAMPGQLVLMTSTTYAGCTSELISEPLAARGLVAGADLNVAFSPERINPGVADFEIEDVPRVVGGATQACTEAAVQLLSGYTKAVHRTSSIEVAEMTKLLENTFRAVNIAMANEFAEACRALNLPVHEVIDSAATKPFGFMPFVPGPGVGGHCIPCDPHYLLWQLRRHKVNLPLIEQAMNNISQRPTHTSDRCQEVLSAAGKGLPGARILVIGLAYKPDVADLRESPSLEIIRNLVEMGSEVAFYDHHFEEPIQIQGSSIANITDPLSFSPDLVLLHTRHRDADLSWIQAGTPVLDATYRAGDISSRILL